MGIIVPNPLFDYDNTIIMDSVERYAIKHTLATTDNSFLGCFGINNCHTIIVVDRAGRALYSQLGGGGYYWLETALSDLLGATVYPLQDTLPLQLGDFEQADSIGPLGYDWWATQRPWRSLSVSGEYFVGDKSLHIEKGSVEFKYRGRRLYALIKPLFSPSLIGVRLNRHPLRSHLMGDDVMKIGDETFIKLDILRLYSVVDGGWGEYRLTLKFNQPCELYALNVR
ncbi:MAG: hypothetical protein QW453_05600 [Thermoprotei archaeon]